jgi:hypothetical protein
VSGWRFAASPFVLCKTGLTDTFKTNLNTANGKRKLLLTLPKREGARLRLPVSSGSTFDFILTELP